MAPRSPRKDFEVNREVNELALLWEVNKALNQSIYIRDVVGPVLNALAEQMGMSRGMLTLLNRKTGEISIEVAHGLSEKQRSRGKYQIGEGIIGRVVKTGKPVMVPHISDEPLFLDRTGSRKALQKTDISFICVPIKIGT